MDDFLSIQKCQRCGGDLRVRTCSWFTDETICSTCSDKETPIKRALREHGHDDACEGIGFVPDPAKLPTVAP
jgi:recombinational DNA repair protein (RecF pathway)